MSMENDSDDPKAYDPKAYGAYLDDLKRRKGEKGIEEEAKKIMPLYTFEEFVEGMNKRREPGEVPTDWVAFKKKWGHCFQPSL